ncbi:hypothetical protein SPRG_10262 [Saprolegnia parasitica CBS 223.65]|uniref:Uncharacterized protein n=1 Tax=Saprolegnia parasitica (strain CBS 223.65) TaxID=695850 RepID=A0A067C2L1_SAPPC|nr:hypothetical protein SPRG_10262 [Saprolegnia parasitica CBS 223.65]KDO24728.1 hypothetical protein SPRG_10262 [Saprolegnia parasitica CBS 223.65]|eukprot:XP_012204608.1 hypothetical protein SPRG_10262 [Saprolegnia parasitica CBS 223.65]
MGDCFSDVGCRKHDWAACGYAWLVLAPVGFLWIVWLGVGIVMLQRHGGLTKLFPFDPKRIHDPLAQGVAVALSQRRSDSVKRPRLLRYLKVCAMVAEWPSFTCTPLLVAMKATNESHNLTHMLSMLTTTSEAINVLVAALCGVCILLLRQCATKNEALLMRFAYPITFDVLYIPFITTFLRLATCPNGYDHMLLPGTLSCECVDHYGVCGLLGFLLLYGSTLHYKTHIEPLGTTMDFRFQTSFQVIMVMARTHNPVVSILVNAVDLARIPGAAIGISICLCLCASFLLLYTYETQPCIGSGRVPNNLRAVSFSSSIYTSLCVLALVVTGSDITPLYYALTLLPVVWGLAWTLNNRRASLYNIPDLSILDLLEHPSSQAHVVGAIAAFHVDVTKVNARDYASIYRRLEALAKGTKRDPLCRIYAIRTLWFCHVESYRFSDAVVGECDAAAVLPDNWWRTDDANPNARALRARAAFQVIAMDARRGSKRVPTRVTVSSKSRSFTTSLPLGDGSSGRIIARGTQPFHVIRVQDKHWISKTERPDEAADALKELYQRSLEALAHARAMEHPTAMYEASIFLLQWYKSQYLQLSKFAYMEILATLCATHDPKLVMDVTHSLYAACTEGVVPIGLWLRHASFLNYFMHALGHSSRLTVFKCATVLWMVLEAAVMNAGHDVDLFHLFLPSSMAKLSHAFWVWHAAYDISDTLERIYLLLQDLETRQRHRKAWTTAGSDAGDENAPWLAKLRHGVAHMLAPGVRRSFASRNMSQTRRDATLLSVTSRVQIRPSLPTSTADRPESRTGLAEDRCSTNPPLRRALSSTPTNAYPLQERGHSERGPRCASLLQPIVRESIVSGCKSRESCMPESHVRSPEHAPSKSPPEATRRKQRRDRYALVPHDVATEIDRRRTLRKEVDDLLQQAYMVHHSASPRRSFVAALDKSAPRSGHRNSELVSVAAYLVGLYKMADRCAIEDYITNAVEPHLCAFFEDHIKPYLAIAATAPGPSSSRRVSWLFAS